MKLKIYTPASVPGSTKESLKVSPTGTVIFSSALVDERVLTTDHVVSIASGMKDAGRNESVKVWYVLFTETGFQLKKRERTSNALYFQCRKLCADILKDFNNDGKPAYFELSDLMDVGEYEGYELKLMN